MTPPGLAATVGTGAALLAAVLAPVGTVLTLAGVLPAAGGARRLRSGRSTGERVGTDDEHRPLHRLLTEAAGAS